MLNFYAPFPVRGLSDMSYGAQTFPRGAWRAVGIASEHPWP
jgi:hypothetical protein